MIATIDTGNGKPCVVLWSGRKGLSVGVRTYCGLELAASSGILQLPDNAKVCDGCDHAVKRASNS